MAIRKSWPAAAHRPLHGNHNRNIENHLRKSHGWLTAGTRLVLLVDPGTRTLHVYRAADNIVVLDETLEFNAGDVVPGWRFVVRELFR